MNMYRFQMGAELSPEMMQQMQGMPMEEGIPMEQEMPIEQGNGEASFAQQLMEIEKEISKVEKEIKKIEDNDDKLARNKLSRLRQKLEQLEQQKEQLREQIEMTKEGLEQEEQGVPMDGSEGQIDPAMLQQMMMQQQGQPMSEEGMIPEDGQQGQLPQEMMMRFGGKMQLGLNYYQPRIDVRTRQKETTNPTEQVSVVDTNENTNSDENDDQNDNVYVKFDRPVTDWLQIGLPLAASFDNSGALANEIARTMQYTDNPYTRLIDNVNETYDNQQYAMDKSYAQQLSQLRKDVNRMESSVQPRSVFGRSANMIAFNDQYGNVKDKLDSTYQSQLSSLLANRNQALQAAHDKWANTELENQQLNYGRNVTASNEAGVRRKELYDMWQSALNRAASIAQDQRDTNFLRGEYSEVLKELKKSLAEYQRYIDAAKKQPDTQQESETGTRG